MEEYRIWTIDWPSYSSDFNSIEYVWKKMKDILYNDFPELLNLGFGEEDRAVFEVGLKEV